METWKAEAMNIICLTKIDKICFLKVVTYVDENRTKILMTTNSPTDS